MKEDDYSSHRGNVYLVFINGDVELKVQRSRLFGSYLSKPSDTYYVRRLCKNEEPNKELFTGIGNVTKEQLDELDDLFELYVNRLTAEANTARIEIIIMDYEKGNCL